MMKSLDGFDVPCHRHVNEPLSLLQLSKDFGQSVLRSYPSYQTWGFSNLKQEGAHHSLGCFSFDVLFFGVAIFGPVAPA